ncbi:MAG: LysR family transcriptional regulator [Symbiopectobacterium sp.]|uniref:LysR family transcriptional regulator n=1 Tax=Symbiopectobacterium sp. TaxID=2952789 RepID=UPI003F2ED22E
MTRSAALANAKERQVHRVLNRIDGDENAEDIQWLKKTMSANKSIDMYAVQVFVTVAEERSMTAAASRLGLMPSAVSQNIRQLEDDFGVMLVNRTRRPFVLTPYGIALKNRGEVLTQEIANLKAQVLEAGKASNRTCISTWWILLRSPADRYLPNAY